MNHWRRYAGGEWQTTCGAPVGDWADGEGALDCEPCRVALAAERAAGLDERRERRRIALWASRVAKGEKYAARETYDALVEVGEIPPDPDDDADWR